MYLSCASRELLESPLDMENYSRRFHRLLHMEEIQMKVDIRKYSLHNQTMTQDKSNKELLVLKVKTFIYTKIFIGLLSFS